MARMPKSATIRKNANVKRLAKQSSVAPAEPINDGGGKFADSGGNTLVVQSGEKQREYSVSMFRDLLAHRPRTGEHVPTEKYRQAVLHAAGLGMYQANIAALMGINVDTMRAHYSEELSIARDLMMHDVQTNIYNAARDINHKDSIKAGMFLLSKLGNDEYKDKKTIEITGKDGKPLQIDTSSRTIDPMMLSHEQRDALRDILNSAMKLAQQPAPVQLEGEYREVSGD
tara:strand:+ start:1618 stop:2301 length:684 start_codon:yes stop_codon:yes gene_type:complete